MQTCQTTQKATHKTKFSKTVRPKIRRRTPSWRRPVACPGRARARAPPPPPRRRRAAAAAEKKNPPPPPQRRRRRPPARRRMARAKCALQGRNAAAPETICTGPPAWARRSTSRSRPPRSAARGTSARCSKTAPDPTETRTVLRDRANMIGARMFGARFNHRTN